MRPYQVVEDFEQALCEYTGAPYAVTVTSCTMALLLAVAWHVAHRRFLATEADRLLSLEELEVSIPRRTYVGVPMSIMHAGARVRFRDEAWEGAYQLAPLPVWDSARWFSWRMYCNNAYIRMPEDSSTMVCVSFHWAKTLGIQQGGAILLNDFGAAATLRMMRFDGRIAGMSPREQAELGLFTVPGWHCYMAPETAAAGLVRLANLPRHNAPIPNDDYPDLSTVEVFK